jgi:nucleotide-binding universal stress UspA family protein
MEDYSMYQRILLPLDGSTEAEKALIHGINLANLSGAELILLRIVEPFPPVRSVSPAELRTIKEHAKDWAEDYFERIAADLREQNIPHETVILEGRASVMIAQFAEQNEIDLILISSRGRTGFTRWLMGSVADRVIRGTTIPVLLVPSEGSSS